MSTLPLPFQDVMNALQEKLNITCVEHFALVLLNMKSPCQKTYSLLQETDSLAEVGDSLL